MLNDPRSLANEFNNYFISVAKNIEAKLIKSRYDYSHFIIDLKEQSFLISPTDSDEVLLNIKKPQLKKI